jgi:hypothetical protein
MQLRKSAEILKLTVTLGQLIDNSYGCTPRENSEGDDFPFKLWGKFAINFISICFIVCTIP